MTNKEFILEVQKSCQVDAQQCLSMFASLQKMLAKAAIDQVPVVINGLGYFTSHKHPEYIQENDKTGEMVLYPPRISCRIQSESVEDAVSASDLLAEFTKSSIEQTTVFLNSMVDIVVREIQNGKEILVPGIGVFKNILTHQTELQRLSFVPDVQLKELVNAPFNCFEPVVIAEGRSEKTVVIEENPATVEENSATIEEEVAEDEPAIVPIVISDKISNVITNEFPDEISDDKLDCSLESTEQTPDIKEETNIDPVEEPTVDSAKIKKEESSTNKLLYSAIAVILCACCFLVWQIFGNDIDQDSHNVVEAVVVTENIAPETVVKDSIFEEEIKADSISVEVRAVDSIVQAPEPVVEKVEKQKIAPAKIVVEEKQKPEVKEPEKPKEFHRMMGADGNPIEVTLQPGERLTLVALQHFGDKAFWPYVFDANADKLKAPNLVQAGMKLYLPDPAYYHIDANDQESLRKAKNRGAQLIK